MALRWRSIRTAPKDRMILVAYDAHDGNANVVPAIWSKAPDAKWPWKAPLVEGWIVRNEGPFLDPDCPEVWCEMPELRR